MNKIDLGQTLTILANVGVIVGIIFLVLELRQNQDLARAQMRNDLSIAFQEIVRGDISGPIVDLVVRDEDGESLSKADQLRLDIWRAMWVNYLNNMYSQFRQGLYTKEGLDAQISTAVRDIRGFSGTLCSRARFDPEFLSYIEDLTGEACR